jgi:hypothetical protein
MPYWVQWRWWMADHYEIPTALVCCYIALVWQVQEKMKLRPAFNLSRFTVAWNWGLSLFSAVGFAHVVTAFVASGAEHGFAGPDSVLCRRDVQFDNQWVALFCLSKIPELVDTALLVLQKKPVIFLHWYHHAVTLMYCWIAWIRVAPNGALFALMNLFVHTIMYAYYAITGMIPRNDSARVEAAAGGKTEGKAAAAPSKGKGSFINKVKAAAAVTITPLQILQMIIGSYAIFHNLGFCPDSDGPAFAMFGGAMYLSYLVLFLVMFSGKINTFFGSPAARPAKDAAKLQ